MSSKEVCKAKPKLCFAIFIVVVLFLSFPVLVGAESEERQLIPISICHEPVNGFSAISKVFSLPPYANPASIPTDSFEMFNQYFSLGFMTQDYTMYAATMEIRETITIETSTNSLNDILPSIEHEIWFDRDGYTGMLTLDMQSIRSQSAGTTTNNATVRRTRTYPHLPSQDSSLIPRTINEGGITLNLYSVSWQIGSSTDIVDGLPIGATYTATATYTGSLSQTRTIGYVTTADYVGTISRLAQSQILYTVVFFGTPITPPPGYEEVPTIAQTSGHQSSEESHLYTDITYYEYEDEDTIEETDETDDYSVIRRLVDTFGVFQLAMAATLLLGGSAALIFWLKPRKSSK